MSIKVSMLLPACVVLVLQGVIPVSHAATLGVSATLLPACSMGTTSNGTTSFGVLNFGNYASLSTAIKVTSAQAAGSIRVNCINGVGYKIVMDGGSSGNVANRTLVNTANNTSTVLYNLYTTASGATVWDNITGISDIGNGADQWHTVFGIVPVQTTPAAGTYADTVNVTVSW
ncbi:Csu type fimbrial protein [Rouxiella sp. Mn2063]|uniref:Csu type fimbrial protein n=1 Tax=Rouxiella sp. Mn2063 TaxID=3395262 RepID=UPI003BDA02E2